MVINRKKVLCFVNMFGNYASLWERPGTGKLFSGSNLSIHQGGVFMTVNVYMPKLGMTMKEGTVSQWYKSTGDRVETGEKIAEIMSDKITNEVEAPGSGTIGEILVQEGETVAIGTVIAHICDEGTNDTKEQKNNAITDEGNLDFQVKPLNGHRKIIGEKMTESLIRSPQGTISTRVDMTGVITLRDSFQDMGLKVSFTDILVKAAALAVKENPVINSSVQDDMILSYRSINIGVAVGLEGSLYVPVIKNADKKSIKEISNELKEFTEALKEGSLRQEDLSGGTFTISNLGMFDVDFMTPIINPPEAGILAVGKTRKEAVVDVDDTIKIRPVAIISLTIDHRVMDGIPAARFLETFKRIIEKTEMYTGEV